MDDGPMYQDSNAYLDIQPVHVTDCAATGCVGTSQYLAGNALGLPVNAQNQCYMPNAAIAWKPPATTSKKQPTAAPRWARSTAMGPLP